MPASLSNRPSVANDAPKSDASRVVPSLFSLAWPSIVENLLLVAVGIASMMMVGRLGATAVAGVGAANQVANLLIVIFNGLSVGNTALVARAVGQGDLPLARSTVRQSLELGLVVGAVIGTVGFVFDEQMLHALGAEEDVVATGVPYLQAVMATLPLMAIALLGSGSLRGSGDTRTPMLITAMMNVANIIVAYLLIFGLFGLPTLGVVGAAWGVVAARLAGTILVLRALAGRRSSIGGCLKGSWWPHLDLIRRISTIGVPAAVESGSIQLGMIAFSVMVISLGTAAFAAQQIVFNAANLSMMPGLAFSVAATTLVGQHLGAGDPEAAQRSGWRGVFWAALWMSVGGLAFILAPEPLIRLYTDDPAVVAAGAAGLRVIGFGQPLQAAAFVLSGALRGAGDTRTTAIVGTAAMWGFRIPVAYVLGLGLNLGVTGVWLGWLSDWSLRGILYVRSFRSGRWRTLKV